MAMMRNRRIVMFYYLCLFLGICYADLRHREIKKGNPSSLVLLDVFEFAEARGRIELNVSDIFLSISKPCPNLSQIGFFIAEKGKFVDLYPEVCYFQHPLSSMVTVMYTLDQLPQGKDYWDSVYNFDRRPNVVELFFHNCLSDNLQISMRVTSAMFNILPDGHLQYLSPTKKSNIPLLVGFLLFYISLASKTHHTFEHIIAFSHVRCYHTLENLITVSHFSYFMLRSILAKSLSILLEVLYRIHINNAGYSHGYVASLLGFMSPFFEELAILLLLVVIFPRPRFKYMFQTAAFLLFLLTLWKFPPGLEPCGSNCAINLLSYRLISLSIFIFLILANMITAIGRLLYQGLTTYGRAEINLNQLPIVTSIISSFTIYLCFNFLLAFVFEALGAPWRVTHLPHIFLVPQVATALLYIFVMYKLLRWAVSLLTIQINPQNETQAIQMLQYRVIHHGGLLI